MIKTILISLALSLTMLNALDCNNAETTYDMKDCALQDFQAIDKELNSVYKKLMNLLDSGGKQKLKTAQKAWIVFRDAQAKFSADYARGGTLERLLFQRSQVDTTQKRVVELKSILEDLQSQ